MPQIQKTLVGHASPSNKNTHTTQKTQSKYEHYQYEQSITEGYMVETDRMKSDPQDT